MIEVKLVEAEIFEKLIRFAYTGEITLSNKNVKWILQAADFLQMKPVTELCTDFIVKHFSVYNVVDYYLFAKNFMDCSLLEKTKSFLYKNFGEVVEKAEQAFFQLGMDDMLQVISRSELEVNTEEDIFNVVDKWIQANSNNKTELMKKLLPKVRIKPHIVFTSSYNILF